MINDLDLENLKEIVAQSLPPQYADLIDIRALTKEAPNIEVAREIVQDAIAHEIQVKSNEEFYRPIYRAVAKMKADCCNAAFIKGKPGFGKSYNIQRALKMNGLDYVEITGRVTEAALYELLHNSNGKVLWLNDISSLLSGLGSVNLLKAATEVGKERVLTNNSYSYHQSKLPPSFKFNGKVIFDYNEVHGDLKGDFDALVNRGDFVQLNFQPEEMAEIMRNAASTEKDLETTEFCIKHCDPDALNLRVQQKAIMTRKYAQKSNLDWQKEVADELRKYKGKEFYKLYDVIGNKIMTTVELKKKLMTAGLANSIRSADRKVGELEFSGVLKKVDDAKRNYKVQMNW